MSISFGGKWDFLLAAEASKLLDMGICYTAVGEDVERQRNKQNKTGRHTHREEERELPNFVVSILSSALCE